MSPWRPDSQCGSGVRAVISECQLCQPCSSHHPPAAGLRDNRPGRGWGRTGRVSRAPTGMGASKPGPGYCLCLSSSPLPPQSIFHTAPRASFLKHNPDIASLKNFPRLPISWRPRVKFLIMAFKACLPSFLHLFVPKKNILF